MPVSRRNWRSCSWLYSASTNADSVLRSARPGKHSKRKRRPQSHWARSARGRKSSGASSRPNHFRIVKGAVGLAQGSELLTEIWPPLAKLVSSAGSGCRSTTVTSWPLCARYHALVVPMTPAPRTTTLTLASEKTRGGKLAPSPPLPCPSPVSERLRVRVFGAAAVGNSLVRKRIYPFDLRTASEFFARRCRNADTAGELISQCRESPFAAAHPAP